MKRVIYDAYGTVDGLRCVDAPSPAVTERQVLVQVKAVALNPIDWKVLEGQLKLVTGSKFPRGIASEFAGVVTATGPAVTQFSVGDEVFGMLDAFKGGALAELIAVDEAVVHRKPRELSFAEASALPVGGLSGLQIVDDLVRVRPGMKVLVNGAAGGVGTFVTQLAVRRGARVTAVVGSRGVALARSWSCEAVVDYRNTNLSTLDGGFDAVVDLSDKLQFRLARPLLAPSGTYVTSQRAPRRASRF